MSEYNPSTKILQQYRKPESKICPHCGQIMPSEHKPVKNDMNRYVNDLSGVEIVVNGSEPYLDIEGAKWRRSDIPKPTPKEETKKVEVKLEK